MRGQSRLLGWFVIWTAEIVFMKYASWHVVKQLWNEASSGVGLYYKKKAVKMQTGLAHHLHINLSTFYKPVTLFP